MGSLKHIFYLKGSLTFTLIFLAGSSILTGPFPHSVKLPSPILIVLIIIFVDVTTKLVRSHTLLVYTVRKTHPILMSILFDQYKQLNKCINQVEQIEAKMEGLLPLLPHTPLQPQQQQQQQ
jgi:hypothetical protein